MVLGLAWFLASKFFINKPSTVKDITLTYWGLWEPAPSLQAVFTSFEAEHPGVKINYVIQSPKDYRERLQAAIDRGQGPDIFRFHNSWVPMLKNELSAIPKNIMSGSEFEKTFYPTAHNSLKLSGSYVGIPLEFDGLALYYNKDIFIKANKTPPKTWDETRKLASQLALKNAQNRIIRGGIALGTTSNVDHWPDILALLILQNAANPATPTDERAEDSLAFYTIFSKSDKVWDDTMPASTIAFAEEKVAMMIAPSWRVFDIKELNPNLNFATVPTPQPPNVNLHWASYWAEGVSSQSDPEKQELSWALLNFMVQPDNLRKFYQDASQTRYFGEPYPRVDMAEELIDDPIVGAYITSAKTAQGWWLSSWTFDNGLNDRIIKYYEDAVNAVNGNKSPQSALETTSEGVVQILSQFGVSGAL
jgi:multiple sugar transport system substrate-binding protein